MNLSSTRFNLTYHVGKNVDANLESKLASIMVQVMLENEV